MRSTVMVTASAIAMALVIAVSSQLEARDNQAGVAQGNQKPVREEVLNVSYRRPPETVGDMVSAAAAVVVAEWPGQSRGVDTGVSGGGIPLPRETAYTFRILDIVKLHPLLPTVGGDIELKVIGGEQELPTHVERTTNRDASNFVQHHRYVMFLGLDASKNELYLMWGPLGVYDISDRSVTSLSPNWRRHNGADSGSFLNAAMKSAGRK